MTRLFLTLSTVVFVTIGMAGIAEAKSKAACTRLVKAKTEYLTAGGRCGEDCRTAIDKCVKGQKI